MPRLPPIRPNDKLTAEQIAHAGAFDAPMVGPQPRLIADYALRLGDDALILAQRLSEWVDGAPTDGDSRDGLSTAALDLLGQATKFLALAGSWEGQGRTADRLAFQRDVSDFNNCLLVEQPNGDFAGVVVRLWLFATYQMAHYAALSRSIEPRLADLAGEGSVQVRRHVAFSGAAVLRVARQSSEGQAGIQTAFDRLWPYLDELFLMDPLERELAASGIGVHRGKLRPAFEADVVGMIGRAGLRLPEGPRGAATGRKGEHSEHLAELLAKLRRLPRVYANPSW